MRPEKTYARADLAAWVRNRCPDLRISYSRVSFVEETGPDGEKVVREIPIDKVASGARFTLDGELVELQELDDPDGEKVVRAAAERVRESDREPPLFPRRDASRRELERQILLAVDAGNQAEADLLTREMLFGRAGNPASIYGAKTAIGTRKT